MNRNVDILFVIDDSPSMADKQTNLAKNFPDFINVLNTIQGGLPDVHIGVVTSDVGSKGAEDAAPGPSIGSIGNGGCSGERQEGRPPDLRRSADDRPEFISDIKHTDGTPPAELHRRRSPTVFATMASVGAGGCGFEQHLESMKRALNNNPVERRLPPPRRVPRGDLHRGRGRLLDRALDDARTREPDARPAARRSAARGSASRVTRAARPATR